jgi:hypothetical protein
MARVQFDIIGEPEKISVGTFFGSFSIALTLLREFDQAISGKYHGSLLWYISRLHGNGSLSLQFRSDPKRKKKEPIAEIRDFGPQVTNAFVTGFENIEKKGISPPYLSEFGMARIDSLLRFIKEDRAKEFEVSDLTRSVRVSNKSSENLGQLLPVTRESIGSIEGKLEAISIHKRPRVMVYHSITRKAVTCRFEESEFLDAMKSALGHRVVVSGNVHSNIKGEPIRVEMEALRVLGPESALPDIEELGGSDPMFTGEMTTDEFIRSIRGG